jgi:hypothetical protein
VYKEGAIMLPHVVDRLPLVVSAVISVAVSLQNGVWAAAVLLVLLYIIIFLRVE